MFKHKRTIVYFILGIVLSLNLYSVDHKQKPEELLLTQWNSKKGLPSDNVTDIVQDKKGYIWIGTYNGLVRFDGHEFEIFSKNNNSGFPSNSIYSLCLTRNGTLWIGTNGDGVIQYLDNVFKMVSQKDGLIGNIVKTICEMPDGTIIAGTNHGVSIIHPDFSIENIAHPLLKDKDIILIFLDSRGKLWLSCSDGSLMVSNSDFSDVYPDHSGLNNVISITEDYDNTLWFGTLYSGMFSYKNNSLSEFKYNSANISGTVNSILFDGHNTMWIATDSGVFRKTEDHLYPFNTSNGFNDNLVQKILEDYEGNIWIATSRSGISKLTNGKFLVIDTGDGLSHSIVNAVTCRKNGDYVFGTDSGINIYRNGSFVTNKLTDHLKNIRIRHVMEDSQGRLWISTYGETAVTVWDDKTIVTYNKQSGLSGTRCRMVLEDKNNNYWIATSKGLNRLSNGTIKIFSKENGLPNIYILCLFESSSGSIWVGTNGGGLAIIDEDQIKVYTKLNGLPSNFIFRVIEDSYGNIWISTNEGICLFRDNNFHTYNMKNGLYGNAIFQMLEDTHKTLWMTSETGVFTVSLDELIEKHNWPEKTISAELYNSVDGLPGAPTPISWAFPSHDNKLWFPTLKGVAVINPDTIRRNLKKPPVYIQEIVVDDLKFLPDHEIILKPDFKRMTVHFTALSYMMPEEIMFKYRLNGFEEKWTTTRERTASYTGLPGQTFTFEVSAINNDGIWSENPASAKIKRQKRFSETVYFFMFIGFICLFLTGMYFRVRNRVLRKRKEELERIVSERTKEIEEKNTLLEEQKAVLEKSQQETILANKKLEKMSITDTLTGLRNRRFFVKYLEHEWKRALRSGNMISLIMLDVDHFKYFNDTYGHQEGDLALTHIAEDLNKALFRNTDMPARYGGEEFIIILPETDRESAEIIVTRIMETIRDDSFLRKNTKNSDRVTVSMGLFSMTPSPDRTFEYMIKQADKALYEAKHQGRNNYVVFKDKED